jgi:hypothetical protein
MFWERPADQRFQCSSPKSSGLAVRLSVDCGGDLALSTGRSQGYGSMNCGVPIPGILSLHDPFRVVTRGGR